MKYDYAGNVFSRTNYDNTTSEYRYDGANRLVAERNQDFLQVSYHYDGAGRLLNRILSNGSKTDYIWDDGNRLLSLKNTSANSTVVNDTTYIRDRLGNITSQTDSSGTTTFTYDALYRLTNADYPGTVNDQTYTYDNVGNRKTMTKNGSTLAYVYDVGNRMKEIRQGSPTGTLQNSYAYDDDGNVVTKKSGSGATLQSYVYDAKGRAKTITTSGIGTPTTLVYDPYDYRIAKTDTTGTRKYLLEGEHLETTLDGNNDWKAMYLRGAVIDEIVNAYYFDTNNRWINYTFHHDALQSVLGLSGHEGSVLQTIQYGPFGDKISTTGTAPTNYLHYTGREEDPDTGLYNYRARLYDPTVGRFITEDPKGFGAGVNFYVYVGNNPINGNDPSGQWTASLGVSVSLGAIFGGGGGTFLNVGHDPSKSLLSGWSFSLTGTAEGGALGGAGGSVQIQGMVTNAKDVNQLNGTSMVTGKSYGQAIIGGGEWVKGSDYNGASLFGGLAVKNPYATPVTGYVFGSTTSAIYQYSDGVHSIGNTGQDSIWSSKPQTVQPSNNNSTLDLAIPGLTYSNFSTPLSDSLFSLQSDPGNSWSAVSGGSAAAGGYLIYPNKPNTNMMRSVYSK